ncbi:MAG TPA: hypothetical protein VGD02_13160 [Gemmatimonadaceae bacterium]|jgi:hypothetical protein
MNRPLLVAAFLGVSVYACGDLTSSSDSVLSMEFDTLGAPSVVVGDSLRDTTGALIRPVVRVFNGKGEEIESPTVRFQSPDSGVHVDSITGVIRADSLRSTAARIFATVGSLQALQRINVTLRPDSIAAVADSDMISYSLTDSTLNLSKALSVKLIHGVAPNDSAVGSWIVSFAIVSQTDPALASLVADNGKASLVDTTGTDGIASRQIRLHPVALPSATAQGKIVVNATAKYRGAQVKGSPVRIVVTYQPRS